MQEVRQVTLPIQTGPDCFLARPGPAWLCSSGPDVNEGREGRGESRGARRGSAAIGPILMKGEGRAEEPRATQAQQTSSTQANEKRSFRNK